MQGLRYLPISRQVAWEDFLPIEKNLFKCCIFMGLWPLSEHLKNGYDEEDLAAWGLPVDHMLKIAYRARRHLIGAQVVDMRAPTPETPSDPEAAEKEREELYLMALDCANAVTTLAHRTVALLERLKKSSPL